MFAKNQSAFDRNRDFHLFRATLNKLTQKIISLESETADSYIQSKLTALELIRSHCEDNIRQYNHNHEKYPDHQEKTKYLMQIFGFKFGLLIFQIASDEKMANALFTHRHYSGSAYSRLPLITGVLSGALACSLAGPFAAVLGGASGLMTVKNLQGIKDAAPESAKIFLELIESNLASKGVNSIETALQSKKELNRILVIKDSESLASDLKECAEQLKNIDLFRWHSGRMDFYIQEREEWLDCSFLNSQEITLILESNHKATKEALPARTKVFLEVAYHHLNATLNVKEPVQEMTV